jgi:hypothetical protein
VGLTALLRRAREIPAAGAAQERQAAGQAAS